MGSTALHAYPYPEGSDQPVVHQDFKALAEDIDQDAYVECLSSSRPAHKAGRRIYEADTELTHVSTGTVWLLLGGPPVEWEYTGMAGPTANNADAFPSYTTRPRAVGVTAEAVNTAVSVTVTRPGLYRVGASMRLSPGTSGLRALSVLHQKNGVNLRRATSGETTAGATLLNVNETFRAATGDNFRVIVFTAVQLTVDNGFGDNAFSGEWVRP